MLSRLFLIPILLLVGITAVAIGAPVAETIESAKAVEISQMGFGNLTLNRRFIVGVPGPPQCPNKNFPQFLSSYCFGQPLSVADCASQTNPPGIAEYDMYCPKASTCMDFRTDNEDEYESKFAVCIDNKLVKHIGNGGKNGVFCKTFEFNIKSERGTVSINVYDNTQKPFQVESFNIYAKNENLFMKNAHTYSFILDNEVKKIKVCLETNRKTEFFAMFSYLDGTYSSNW
ncbi:hypothetical protein Glove_176g61 [Diversispora epigaea]|uniref:Secreted protein n=1 Tax=Diversispora epigaea TaxID=1348612 RepID=A0A397INP0_9GLOM|nr:hypothetical protein Glove_176g61 [Diversispora epigaea]